MSGREACAPRPAWIAAARLLAVLLVATGGAAAFEPGCEIAVDAREARALADRVWRNESGGDYDKIVWWNQGEGFASVGIGHFIWYPAGVDGPFRESFPELLDFLSARAVPMPGWLADGSSRSSPWATRAEFIEQRDGRRARELRRLLVDTVALQAEFMLERLEAALTPMTEDLPRHEARLLESRFCQLADTPSGRYALLDYVNFKGEGTDPGERYRGEGWGLKQVLAEMRDHPPTVDEFSAAAARVLERRVRNAPSERRESRWLSGWLRRVESYPAYR